MAMESATKINYVAKFGAKRDLTFQVCRAMAMELAMEINSIAMFGAKKDLMLDLGDRTYDDHSFRCENI
nr:hypothetical protein Itr_chr02CG08880 [Ipomoea trifida]GMC62789.1 hypothetical protein Iba_chr02cCG7170 [Ipomoea batatas]